MSTILALSHDISIKEEKARKKGLEEGLEKGRKEGRKEGRRLTAVKLKESGVDLNVIKDCTGLTLEEIEKL